MTRCENYCEGYDNFEVILSEEEVRERVEELDKSGKKFNSIYDDGCFCWDEEEVEEEEVGEVGEVDCNILNNWEGDAELVESFEVNLESDKSKIFRVKVNRGKCDGRDVEKLLGEKLDTGYYVEDNLIKKSDQINYQKTCIWQLVQVVCKLQQAQSIL